MLNQEDSLLSISDYSSKKDWNCIDRICKEILKLGLNLGLKKHLKSDLNLVWKLHEWWWFSYNIEIKNLVGAETVSIIRKSIKCNISVSKV